MHAKQRMLQFLKGNCKHRRSHIAALDVRAVRVLYGAYGA
jgi:hypothetical protein